jgi:hypothetical protein
LHKFVYNHKIPNNMKKIILLLTILVQVSVVFSQHFVKGFVGGGYNQMNLIINNASISGVQLKAGDEIAVFDGNLCVGAIVLTQDLVAGQSSTYPLLIASADDGNANGFKQGNKMYFRFWSAGIEYHNVIPIVTDNQGASIPNSFEPNGTAYINASTANTTKTWTGADDDSPTAWNVSGNWSPSGVPEPIHNVVIPSGTPTISTTNLANCGSLTFNTSTIRIRSDGSTTGSLIVASNISGNGVLNSRRFMTGNSWHLVSSPSSGQTIADFLTTNGEIPSNEALRGMMEYNEGADNWSTFFTNSTSGEVSLGKGFGVRTTSDTHVAFQGALNSGNVSVSISRSNNGWNLLGNPFTSAMYIKQEVFGFLTVNENKIDPSYLAMYLWDPVADKYVIVNKSEGQANLASGQGFFVKAKAAGNVTFTQAMQVHQTNAPFKSGVIQWPSVVLSAKAGDISSSTKINFNEEMTLGLDPGYDAGIFRGGKGFDIYSKLITDNGVDFAIQALPGKSTDSYVIPIGVDAVKGGEVVFSVNSLNLPAGYDLMIEDKLTNSIANLKNGEMYVANVAANNKGTGRFYLHVGSSVQTAVQEIQQNELSVYTIDQTLYIKGNVGKNAQFMVYSIDGRLINRFGATSQNLNQMSTAGFTPGIYFVNVLDKTKYKPVKFVVGN